MIFLCVFITVFLVSVNVDHHTCPQTVHIYILIAGMWLSDVGNVPYCVLSLGKSIIVLLDRLTTTEEPLDDLTNYIIVLAVERGDRPVSQSTDVGKYIVNQMNVDTSKIRYVHDCSIIHTSH